MIARVIIIIILSIVLPDYYLYRRFVRGRKGWEFWRSLLWIVPSVAMLLAGIALAFERNFLPSNYAVAFIYLLLYCLFILPKAFVAVGCWVGRCLHQRGLTKRDYGVWLGLLPLPFIWGATIWGTTIGVSQLEVKHIDLTFNRLPKSFDGYRIVQFSDLHVGTYSVGRMELLQRNVDSICAQKADLIVFTGDLQDMVPQEIDEVSSVLRKIKAKDGVISVLGNHDYAEYTHEAPAIESRNMRATIAKQEAMGWKVLRNEHVTLHRGNDTIVVAGEENFMKPARSNLARTLKGVKSHWFTIMLQHIPDAWQEELLPSKRVDLTMSGHTHGGQMQIFGLRPTMLRGKPDKGLYVEEGRMLYVNAGLGALLPFRLNMPTEITVITLHSGSTTKPAARE